MPQNFNRAMAKHIPTWRGAGSVVIARPAQIGVFASAARQEIVDTLDALGGEASAAELAAQLGRPVDGLYYHLKLLVRGGLVRELANSGEGRRYRIGPRPRLRYRPGRTSSARAVARVATSLLSIAGRDFAAALAKADTVVSGPRRELSGARIKGWVGEAELIEINRALDRLAQLVRRGRDPQRRRLISLVWVLAPITAQPARRGRPASARSSLELARRRK